MTGGAGPRAAEIDAFLGAAGWGDAARAPMGADWSDRRYQRLRRPEGAGAAAAVLMDAPADAAVRAFVEVGTWLRARGLHAPELLAAAPERGLLLLEDMGDALLAAAIDRDGADEAALYALAAGAVLAWQRPEPPRSLPRLDPPALLDLLDLFLGRAAPAAPEPERAAFRALWAGLLPRAAAAGGLAPAFLHRDFHAENALWLEGEPGLWALGLLDFQDARVGPRLYDLVSLVQDARRDVGPAAAAAAIGPFRDAHPALGEGELGEAVAILGAQRAMRILGVVGRLRAERGREPPPGLEARVRAHLASNLGHPALRGLRAWCRRHYPEAAPPG